MQTSADLSSPLPLGESSWPLQSGALALSLPCWAGPSCRPPLPDPNPGAADRRHDPRRRPRRVRSRLFRRPFAAALPAVKRQRCVRSIAAGLRVWFTEQVCSFNNNYHQNALTDRAITFNDQSVQVRACAPTWVGGPACPRPEQQPTFSSFVV